MENNTDSSFESKLIWVLLVPIVVSIAANWILDERRERIQQRKDEIKEEQLQEKVDAYCTLWERQVSIDTAKLWSDYRADSIYLHEARQDSLQVSQSYWSARGLGRSSAVAMSRDKINMLFDNRMRKARNLVEAQTSAMLYQLNAFRKTGMVIKPD